MRKRPVSFEDLLNPPAFVWPERGNRLLKPTNDRDKAVTFSPHGFDRQVHIWSGYMRAGEALIGEAERDPLERHFLIYPVLFTYRHAFELAMKWTIETYGGHNGTYLDPNEQNHDLWKLWQLCKKVIVEIGGESASDEGIAGIEQLVKDFHDLDKDGTAFRYSRTKAGTTINLPKTTVDLDHIQQMMERVDNFFKGTDGMLDHLTSI